MKVKSRNGPEYKKLLDRKVWLFDFDGVLVPSPTKKDHKQFISNAIELISDFKNIPIEEGKQLYASLQRKEDENNLYVFFAKNFPDIEEDVVFSRIFRKYNEKYKKMKPHNGITKCLKMLTKNKITLGILTNNSGAIVRDTIERFEYRKYFSKIIASEELYPFLKPEEFSYKIATKSFGVTPNETVFIDDSENNVKASKKLGILSVHITDKTTNTNSEIVDFTFESSIKLLKAVVREIV